MLTCLFNVLDTTAGVHVDVRVQDSSVRRQVCGQRVPGAQRPVHIYARHASCLCCCGCMMQCCDGTTATQCDCPDSDQQPVMKLSSLTDAGSGRYGVSVPAVYVHRTMVACGTLAEVVTGGAVQGSWTGRTTRYIETPVTCGASPARFWPRRSSEML